MKLSVLKIFLLYLKELVETTEIKIKIIKLKTNKKTLT